MAIDSLGLVWLNAYLRQCLGGPLRAAFPSGVTMEMLRSQWESEGRGTITYGELRDGCVALEYYLNGDHVIGVPGTF